MRKMLWSAGMLAVLLLSTTAVTVSSAETLGGAAPVTPHAADKPVGIEKEADAVDVAPLLARIATIPEFAGWRGGQAVQERILHDPSGAKNARLWSVKQGNGKQGGYLVTTLDGQQVYEFSRRSDPTLPAELEGSLLQNGFLYAGPMQHLAYIQSAEGMNLYNLVTNETMPTGELLGHVPNLTAEPHEQDAQPTIEHRLPRSAAPADDALYAVGLHGMKKGVPLQSLISSAKANSFQQKAFVVYDAVPDKLHVVLAVHNLIEQGSHAYFGLQDPFAEGEAARQPLVYIDSRFPVNAILLPAPSAQ